MSQTSPKSFADGPGDGASQATDGMASADQFDRDTIEAQAIEEVARQVDRLADQIRNTDIDRMARTVGNAAQRNPLMFVAGAALAGFAVTRFLTARDPDRGRPQATDDPWMSGTRPSGPAWQGSGPASGDA